MSRHLFDLSGETAVVVGGTGALGGAIAEALGAAGASIAIVGRNAERGNERVAAIESAGGKAAFFAADAVDKNSLAMACDAITRRLGPISVLVNGAGGNRPDAT